MAKGTAIADKHKVTPFVIIDFETSGLDLKKNALTEIAMIAIKGDTLEEIGRYEALIQPYGKQYDQGASTKTGLTEEFLESNGKPFVEVVEETATFLSKANIYKSTTGYKPMIIGHNPLFEVACLQHMEKEGNMTPKLDKLLHGQFDYYGNYQPYYQDTIVLAKYLWAANLRVNSYKLEDVCEKAGIAISDAHRAMNDVIPSNELLKWIIKLLRGAESGTSQTNSGTEFSFRNGFQF